MDKLIKRLRELSDAVTKGKEGIDREFYMSIPARPDHDADLVLSDAAMKLEAYKAQSEWVSVESGEMEFDKEYYVQLTCGKRVIGTWIQCDGYVRFRFNGESRALDYWPASMQPVKWTELPKGPSE